MVFVLNGLSSRWNVTGLPQDAAIWPFWEKAAICDNLPIFNPLIQNFEVFKHVPQLCLCATCATCLQQKHYNYNVTKVRKDFMNYEHNGTCTYMSVHLQSNLPIAATQGKWNSGRY